MKALKPSVTAEALFNLVSSLEPRIQSLKPWFTWFVAKTQKWHHSEGNQGVKRSKNLLNWAWLCILGYDQSVRDSLEPLPFTRTVVRRDLSNKDIPLAVLPLVEFAHRVNKTHRVMSAILTLVRVPELFMAKGNDKMVLDQIRVIQDSKLPVGASKIIQDFERFLALFLGSHPKSALCRQFWSYLELSEKDKLYLSVKAGPNGPLTESSHLDYSTISNYMCSTGSSLGDEILTLGNLICQNVAPGCTWESKPQFSSIPQVGGFATYPGLITCIPEKAGKLRLVASPDYFSQRTLKPLHRWLTTILRSLQEDCTFDQHAAIPKISQWQLSGEEVSSFDQTSCTDLFPFDLQLTILRERFGEKFSTSVKTVMSDRDWMIRLPQSRTTRCVRYGVGQPMGLYASWPLMALAHHLIVQYACWIADRRPPKPRYFHKYVICGDDIVIGSKPVADEYLGIVTGLGMKVNRTKSYCSGGDTNVTPVSEFAKVVVWKGKPLYPIKPNQFASALRDWRLAVRLLIDLANFEGWRLRLRSARKVVEIFWPRKVRVLLFLLTTPLELGGVGYRNDAPWQTHFDTIRSGEVHPWLRYLASRVLSKIRLRFRKPEVPMRRLLSSCDLRLLHIHQHPLLEWYNDASTRFITEKWFAETYGYKAMPIGPKALDFKSKPEAEDHLVVRLLSEGPEDFISYWTGDDSLEPFPYIKEEVVKDELKRSASTWARILCRKSYEQHKVPDSVRHLLDDFYSFEVSDEEFKEIQGQVCRVTIDKIRLGAT